MLNVGRSVVVVSSIFCALFFLSSQVQAEDLAALIRQVEQQYAGDSSRAQIDMTVVTGNWERHLRMESWSLGRECFLIRILAPAKEKGVATLKVERDVWNYLPKVDRVIRIPPSMMGGAWMGSHITNDDLVKANHIDEDYSFSLLDENQSQWVIEGVPKPDAAVVWGKLVYQIQKTDRIPQQVDYYDEEGLLIRRILFDDVQAVGERTVPLRMTVLLMEKTRERTVMHYRHLQFGVDLTRSFFTLGQLKRRR